MTQGTEFTVICCRPDPADPAGPVVNGRGGPADPAGPVVNGRGGPADPEGPAGGQPAGPSGGQPARPSVKSAVREDDRASRTALSAVMDACAGNPRHWVGRRPGKEIDRLLSGEPHARLLVVGDDADLAAVVLRLLRKERLGLIELAFASPRRRTPVTDLWDLPRGAAAVELARSGEVDLVPLVRDDVGGVLVGAGYLGPVAGTVYVDEHRVLRGAAQMIKVEPDRDKGLAVTVSRRRFAGIGRRPKTTLGRAVQIGTAPTTVVRDGIPYPRPMDRWTFYKHTEPLRLVRGLI